MRTASALSLLVLGALFLVSAYLTQTYESELTALIGERSMIGLVAYTGIAALTTVIAPLSSVPLLPLAATIWGPVVAALASIVGWLLGALIAFGIGRAYGRGLVERLVTMEKLTAVEKRIPQENVFWSVVLLRMAIPVDVLSYVLGAFGNISWRIYTLATLIGITPFAFVFAYVGTVPFRYQLVGAAVSVLLILLIWKRK